MNPLLAKLYEEPWPTPVVGWEIEYGLDATDDEAVWVWAVLENANVEYATVAEMRERIRSIAMESSPDATWAYVGFRIKSELSEEATS